MRGGSEHAIPESQTVKDPLPPSIEAQVGNGFALEYW